MVVKDSIDASEWECRLCSLIGRSQTEKMSVLPKQKFRFNVFPIKIPDYSKMQMKGNVLWFESELSPHKLTCQFPAGGAGSVRLWDPARESRSLGMDLEYL